MRARANNRNIASCLSSRTDINFSTKDTQNINSLIKGQDTCDETIEKCLEDIRDESGDVHYKKKEKSNYVDIFWVQTHDMREQLKKMKPKVFECDATFGTQKEGFKLYIPIFHSNLTDMWEVAGLLFLSTETREKVQTGIEFFKASLPYVVSDSFYFIFFAEV